jgi:hypothetical protein
MSARITPESVHPLRAHFQQIFDPAVWRDNPIAHRESRRDSKRRQPHLSYLWTLMALTAVTVAVIWGLFALRRRGLWIPFILGGNPGTALCIAVAGVHSWFITAAAQKHAARFIQQEANANTLTSLLTIPQPPFQTLFSAGIYPWTAAMRIALIGLPFYGLCAALGLPWGDVALLYVVYAAISVAIPAWSWPILSEKSSFVPTAPPQAQTPGVIVGQQQQGQQRTGAQATGFNPGSIFMFIGLFGFLLPTLARGGFGQGMATLRVYLPDNLIELIPTCFLSWPLLMGRALIAPLDWFGYAIPPFPFLATSFLLGRFVQTIRSAEYLQVGAYRDLPALVTYIPVRKLGGTLRIARLFVVTGYLWKWAVVNGGLSFVTRIPAPGGAPGLAGFAFLIFFITGWRLLIRGGSVGMWQSSRPLPPERGIRLAASAADAARYMAEPLAFAGLYFAASCAMSRTLVNHIPIIGMIGKMSLIALCGAALGYSLRRAGGGIATAASIVALLIIPLVSIGPPEAARLSILSPTLGMAKYADLGFIRWNQELASRRAQFRGMFAYLDSAWPWWQWPLSLSGVGVCIAPLWMFRRGRSDAPSELAIQPVTLNPSRCGMEVYNDWYFEKNQGSSKETSPLAGRIIEVVQRIGDNAIAVREMRARLRGQLSAKGIRNGVIIMLVLTVLMIAVPAVTTTFGGSFAPYLLPGVQPLSAAVLLCWYMALLWISVAVGLGMMPAAFAPEREKSTLGFVLVSPMSASAIASGKLAGYVISTGNVAATIILWTLALSLALVGGAAAALILWWKASLTAIIVIVTLALIGLAIAALFPRKGLQTGCGVIIGILAIQIPIQLGLGTGRILHATLFGSALKGWNAETYWHVFLACSGILSVISYLVAVWGIRRMRKGDIAFEVSKQA